LCKCDCGKKKIIRGDAITCKVTKSCGCITLNRNKIDIDGDTAKIWLNGKNAKNGKFAIIDSFNVEKIKDMSWYLGDNGYVFSNKNRLLHRIIKPGYEALDHINRDPLDNRECNLRPCTASENSMNSKMRKNKTSMYRGVSSTITYNKKRIHIGYYDDEEIAAQSYDVFSYVLHGDFGVMNF
jgi:hypothetical protein